MPDEEARQPPQQGGAVLGRAAIIKIDPLLAEESLFQRLQQQVAATPDIAKIIKEYSEAESGPKAIMAIVHVLLRQALASPLGYIIPPDAGANIVKDRIVQSATTLLEMLQEQVRKTQEEIEKSLREGRDYEVEKNARRIIALHHLSLLAIREVMNRYIVLYTINLPPNLRPPLAEVKLGMEVIPA